MSEVFHNSCYTSRSSGYKYRTLSTNTGEHKKRDSNENNTFERKLKELKLEITSRVDNELDRAQNARESIHDKLEKIESKIISMLELQNTVLSLRKNLHAAESNISDVIDKVVRIESAIVSSEAYSLQSKRTSFRSQSPIFEEREVFASTVTHI